jgi:hypothetical protein
MGLPGKWCLNTSRTMWIYYLHWSRISNTFLLGASSSYRCVIHKSLFWWCTYLTYAVWGVVCSKFVLKLFLGLSTQLLKTNLKVFPCISLLTLSDIYWRSIIVTKAWHRIVSLSWASIIRFCLLTHPNIHFNVHVCFTFILKRWWRSVSILQVVLQENIDLCRRILTCLIWLFHICVTCIYRSLYNIC